MDKGQEFPDSRKVCNAFKTKSWNTMYRRHAVQRGPASARLCTRKRVVSLETSSSSPPWLCHAWHAMRERRPFWETIICNGLFARLLVFYSPFSLSSVLPLPNYFFVRFFFPDFHSLYALPSFPRNRHALLQTRRLSPGFFRCIGYGKHALFVGCHSSALVSSCREWAPPSSESEASYMSQQINTQLRLTLGFCHTCYQRS